MVSRTEWQVSLQSLEQHLFVQKARGRDKNRIDIGSIQSLSDIGDRYGRWNRLDSFLCARSVDVNDCRNLGSDNSPGKTLDMIRADWAGTDNTYSEVSWTRFGLHVRLVDFRL
jgi:hypothetical protein